MSVVNSHVFSFHSLVDIYLFIYDHDVGLYTPPASDTRSSVYHLNVATVVG